MAAKPRSVVIVGVLSLAIAAFASYSLYNYLKGQEARVQSAVATSKVVVAAQEIPPGTAINATQLKTVDWPQGAAPQGAFSSTDQVVSRVALDRFAAGEPIIDGKLVPKEGQTGILSYRIPEGHRAMTVRVDDVAGVAGFITPGNRVDVVLTTRPSNQQPISKIVLQNVPVLATGQIIEQKKDEKPVVVPTVTMDVVPEDAEKLAIASTQGTLQLVLRRAGDADIAKTAGATVVKVISSSSFREAPAPGKPAPVRRARARKAPAPVKETKVEKAVEPALGVEVWRSTHKTTEYFKGEKE
jgi:pilus assembly protein CpaB